MTTTEEVAVWTLYFRLSAVLDVVPSASTVETTSIVPTLGSAHIYCIEVLVPQGLMVVSVLSPAHYEVKSLSCRANSPDLLEVVCQILHLLPFLEDSGNCARCSVSFQQLNCMQVVYLHLKVQGLPLYNEIISGELSLLELSKLLPCPVLLVGCAEQPFYIVDYMSPCIGSLYHLRKVDVCKGTSFWAL